MSELIMNNQRIACHDDIGALFLYPSEPYLGGSFMSKTNSSREYSDKMAENLKKALTEMLILSFLSKKNMTIYEILHILDEQSNSICRIQYPYGVIYRMSDRGYIEIAGKAVSNDRRRIHYRITSCGREYLSKITEEYHHFLSGIEMILSYIETLEDDGAEFATVWVSSYSSPPPLCFLCTLCTIHKKARRRYDALFCEENGLERNTRLELATSTLARWRSTRWANSANKVNIETE